MQISEFNFHELELVRILNGSQIHWYSIKHRWALCNTKPSTIGGLNPRNNQSAFNVVNSVENKYSTIQSSFKFISSSYVISLSNKVNRFLFILIWPLQILWGNRIQLNSIETNNRSFVQVCNISHRSLLLYVLFNQFQPNKQWSVLCCIRAFD